MRWLRTAGVGLLVGLTVSSMADARPSEGDAAVEDALVTSVAGIDAAGAMEAEALFAALGRARRTGDSLQLRLAGGKWKTYRNSGRCRAESGNLNCVSYALVAHMRTRGLFVVAKLAPARTSYVVVDALTGSQIDLQVLPRISPVVGRVLVFSADATRERAVTVIERRNGLFEQVWTGGVDAERKAARYQPLGWRSDDAFAFTKTTWQVKGDPALTGWSRHLPSQSETVVELRRGPHTWAPEPPKNPSTPALRWNFRHIGASHHPAMLAPAGEPFGATDVVIGRSLLKISTNGRSWSFTGRVDKRGNIFGVASSFESDVGPAMMQGRYDKALQHLAGRRPDCVLEEIVLRNALSERKPYPDGSFVIAVRQLPETCDRLAEDE